MPKLCGKLATVVQYNLWKGGSLTIVVYEAHEFGVKLSIHGDE